MKKLFLSITCLVLINGAAHAAGDNFGLGARNAGMAFSSVCNTDVWSVQQNQAGMAEVKNAEASVYSAALYANSDILLNGLAFVLPQKFGVLGLSVSRLGFKNLYSDSKYGLAFSRNFGPGFRAGMQISYHDLFIGDNYGRKGTFLVEAGIQAVFTKNMQAAFHIYNPTRSALSSYEADRIPTIMKLGLIYTFNDKVFLSAEGQKDLYNPFFLRMGLEYQIVKQFYLRAGLSSLKAQNSFGFGLKFENLKVDFAAGFHPNLGFTPHAGVSYVFGKKAN